ncbi:MAG: radical SAM protein [Candidatus Korarchaeota archaeon NZ13-K]|nr:MAG: radical SAM protein [Candidatus Korarchaeota archaeon NZ13-K]
MFLILDALASGGGRRLSSLDVIGAGPRLIAGILEKFGLEYRLMRIEDFLMRGKPFRGVSLVSAMSMDEAAARRASKLLLGVKILGGPITSDLTVVKRLGFDLGVWGEGEVSIESLLRGGLADGLLPDARGIPNLVFKDGTCNELRHLSREEFLTFRPSVKAVMFYSTIPHYKCSRIYVEVVRGCSNFNRPKLLADEVSCERCSSCYSGRPGVSICPQGIPPGCGYCSIPLLYGPPKSRDEEAILEEVKGLAEIGVRRIVLSGADFLEYGRDLLSQYPRNPMDPEPNIEAIDSLLCGVRELSLRHGFFFEVENVKPCLVNEDVARILGKYLRGTPIHVGVETGDPEHAKIIGRPCGPDDSLRAIRLLKRYGLRPYAYFIHSLPGQSGPIVNSTVRLMRLIFREGAEKITVYRFKPLPGTSFQDFRVKVDRNSKKMVKIAIELNRRRKRELLGEVIEAVVAPKVGRHWYAYPVRGGPTIRLTPAEGLRVGKIVNVLVRNVLSDRLVEGSIV